MPGASSAFGIASAGPISSWSAGSTPTYAQMRKRGERRVAERPGLLLAHQQHRRGAVGERARVAGGDRAVLGEHRRAACASFSTLVSARTRLSACTQPLPASAPWSTSSVEAAAGDARARRAGASAAANSSCASREISLRLAIRSAASPITSPVVRSAIFGTRGRMSLTAASAARARRGSPPASPLPPSASGAERVHDLAAGTRSARCWSSPSRPRSSRRRRRARSPRRRA